MDEVVSGAADAINAQPVVSGRERETREDMIDAIVCCVELVEAVRGRAQAFGEEDAVIWIHEAVEDALSSACAGNC